MKRILITIGLALLVAACTTTEQKIDKLWSEAEQYRLEEKLYESVHALLEIIDQYPEHPRAGEAQFQIAELYLNDVRDFDLAIVEFTKVLNGYSDTEMAAKALFMIGYIEANYLQAYSDALNHYAQFLNKFPDHELIPSVEYEIESLADIQTEIATLNALAQSENN